MLKLNVYNCHKACSYVTLSFLGHASTPQGTFEGTFPYIQPSICVAHKAHILGAFSEY